MRIGRARVGGASPSRPTEPELDPAREAEEFAHTRARKRPTKRPARPPEVIERRSRDHTCMGAACRD